MSNNYTLDELLAKYLAEENSQEDHELLQAMLSENEESDALLDQSKLIWDSTGVFQQKQTVDVDAAWTKVKSQNREGSANQESVVLVEKQPTVRITSSARKPVRLWAWAGGIAATIALVISAVLWFSSEKSSLDSAAVAMLSAATTDKLLQKTLPDGTKVWLNKHSQIQFPSQFTGNTREISLKGEAFFDVAHDTAHPFIIHAQQTEVKVLGTSFNVKAYDASVSVFVKTGKVKFSQKQASITLTPGQQAQANQASLALIDTPDENQIAYRTQKFVFDNTPLSQVIPILTESYGQKITLDNPAMNACKLTATFEQEKLENIIQIITQTFGFKLKMKGKEYILYGNGCP